MYLCNNNENNMRVNVRQQQHRLTLLLLGLIAFTTSAWAQLQPGDEQLPRATATASAPGPRVITGSNLTIDRKLQSLAFSLIKGKQGSIIAIDPSNGEVLCMATNTPSGENVDMAIASALEPGSTIKVAQALTLLSCYEVDSESAVTCNRGGYYGRTHVGCHRHKSPIKLEDAIAYSCNTWFLTYFQAMIADRVNYASQDEALTTWDRYMRSMGLGSPLGIDIPGERGGLLPDVDYMNRRYKNHWNERTIMWVGMGQGDLLLTPLQLCNLAASIANRGWYITPHIHKLTAATQEQYTTRHETEVSPLFYPIVIDGMRKAVTSGTAAGINTKAYTLCGKTGTAENSGKDHSIFIGFAPKDQPKIAVAVYIMHGGFGADLAAPIASLIVEQYLKGSLSSASQARAKRIAAKRLFAAPTPEAKK